MLKQNIDFVNSQIDYYHRMAIKNRHDASRLDVYKTVLEKFQNLLELLTKLSSQESVHIMTSIPGEYIDFLSRQSAHYLKMAQKNSYDTHRVNTYKAVLQSLDKLRHFLEEKNNCQSNNIKADTINEDKKETISLHSPLTKNKSLSKLPAGFFDNPHSLVATDIAGLSEEVINELNITKSDRLEASIIELIDAAGGTLILDKIIVGLAYMAEETHQRTSITAKLHRMIKKGLINTVKGKRGVYTTHVDAKKKA